MPRSSIARFGLVLALLTAPAAFAQVKSSTIDVVVTDSTGASVPDATVEVIENATNQHFGGQTNGAGEFAVPYLAASSYTVSVRKAGFRPYTQTGLELSSNQTAAVNAVLEVGQNQQVVEVSASAVHLETESSSLQGATSSREIDILPNLNQNAMYYATLQPGVVPVSTKFYETTGHDSFGIGYLSRAAFSNISVNGGENNAIDIQLDGIPIMGTGYNEAAVLPNPEGIREVRVLLNNYTAENGRGQGVTSIITKSGANELHGSANFRLRNEALNANTFQNNWNGVPRQPFKSDAYGGSVGGAILKDKLFYFASYEGLYHSVGEFWLMRVPTAAERQGDFSQTLIGDQNGNPIHTAVYNPFQVTQLGPNLYQRTPVPNAKINNPTSYALKLFSYYPNPNRAPIDVYNDNNFYSSGKQTFEKNSVNARVDYRLGQKHSIYGSGGILKGSITSPEPYGSGNPFFSYASSQWSSQFDKDRNPYASIGDTIVLNPTTVMDIRYGVTRVASISGSADHDIDYNSLGIPAAIQAIMPSNKQAPDFSPGSGISALGSTTWGHKNTHQLTHSTSASITKNLGRWTVKGGAEYRVNLSNYEDFAQGSVEIDGLDGSQYLTANGGGVVQNVTPLQGGYTAASLFQGAGAFSLIPGFDVRPAFASKYFALYSQNDWRMNSKLTLNLGLRWELQPGPTERYGRFSSFDAKAASPFGSGTGAISFPGLHGSSRNLWDTHYGDIGPRLGAAYTVTPSTVVRAGYGIVYLPSNTGYAPGPSRYGEEPFTASALNNFYGANPNGVPVGTMDSGLTTQIILPVGANPTAPQLYGTTSGFPLFSRHNYYAGRVQQFNFVVEKRVGSNWFFSLLYAGTRGSRLPNFTTLTSDQFIPDSVLSAWRASYIATSGVNPGSLQVQNPFQPASGPLLPFSGALANRTINQNTLLGGNPLLTTLSASTSIGSSHYNALEFHVTHPFSGGFLLDAHYTWSKSMSNSTGDMYANSSTFLMGPDLRNINHNWHLGFMDTPHRFVGTFIYSLPFGKGARFDPGNRIAQFVTGGWRVGGVEIIQSGFPLPLTISGSMNHVPNRVAGVPIQLPNSFQHFYDGRTTVTLPSGRKVTPCAGCYLKYNPDAFSGNIVTLANGNVAADPFWYGTAALDYGDIRGPGRFNTDLNLSRTFNITEKKQLEFVANVTNAFNHTQFLPNGNLNTGSVDTADYPGRVTNFNGLSGTQGTATYEPRQVELKLRFQF